MGNAPTGRKSFNVRLTPELMEKIKALASRLGQTVSRVIEDACTKRVKGVKL